MINHIFYVSYLFLVSNSHAPNHAVPIYNWQQLLAFAPFLDTRIACTCAYSRGVPIFVSTPFCQSTRAVPIYFVASLPRRRASSCPRGERRLGSEATKYFACPFLPLLAPSCPKGARRAPLAQGTASRGTCRLAREATKIGNKNHIKSQICLPYF